MDIATIEIGEDFVAHMDAAVAGADAVLVVIGLDWLAVTGADGRRRLDDPADHVRREIATALAQGVRVVPVLVGGAPMPAATSLPVPLAALATRNAVRLADETWDDDVAALVATLDQWRTELAPRAVTVLCAGLRSGSDIAAHLSADDVVGVLGAVVAALRAAMEAFGGITRTTGDMVIGFFVGPSTEARSRALDAILAGLDGGQRVRRLEAETRLALAVSWAAHAGVVRHRGSPETLLDAPNDLVPTAVRLQMAGAGEGVSVSEAVYSLVAGAVVARPAGSVRLHRLPQPVAVWRVEGVEPAPT
jgi:class 3 adenylate cyclase